METIVQTLAFGFGVVLGSFTGIFLIAWAIHRDTCNQAKEIYKDHLAFSQKSGKASEWTFSHPSGTPSKVLTSNETP